MKRQNLAPPHNLKVRSKAEAHHIQACQTNAKGLRTDECMAKRSHSVVLAPQAYDETTYFATNPVVLTIHGRVPGGWLAVERLAA